MVRFLVVVTLAWVATPAFATERAYSPQQIDDVLKVGCSVYDVRAPAGQNGQKLRIVHCKRDGIVEVARKAKSAVELN